VPRRRRHREQKAGGEEGETEDHVPPREPRPRRTSACRLRHRSTPCHPIRLVSMIT
jgi:hypothetical protein